MASTYSPNLRLELIGTGEQQGTWGNTTNTNLGTLLEEAIGGYVSVTVSDVGDTTLTENNGAADQSRNMTLNLTGALTGARNVICPAIEKVYVVKNATTGGYAVTVKVSGQTGVSIPNGSTYFLYVDGTDVRMITGSLANQLANSVSITGGTITGITDLAVADGGTGVSTITGIIKGNGTSAFTAAVAGTDYLSPSAVGTIASQNSNNVSITGGAISNTTINGGTFTGNSSGTNTGDQNIFQTFAVAGQSNVVADSTADTVTFVAGSGVSITTNATADSITISATGSGGTVTSVDVSGGTTGLTTSGGPITGSGTITLAGTLGVTNGGTGATSITGLVKGNGTSAFSAAVAGTDYLTTSNVGTIATQNANAVSITGGSVVANASSLSIRDADASNILTFAVGSNLTANTTLTLTTGATTNRTLDISASNVTISTAGAALIDDADASAQRTTLGLGTIATQNSNNVSITGGSVSGITDLAVADGGTGASTSAGAATNLGLGVGDSPQFAAVNIGSATDTTITRVSAGVIAVEGSTVALEDRTNTFSSNQIISVADNTNAALRVTQTGTGNALLVEDAANPDSSPFVINNVGGVAIGATTTSYNLEVVDTNSIPTVGIKTYVNNANSTNLRFDKARGGAASGPTVVSSGDAIGLIRFYGYDGASFVEAARIEADVASATGSNDMPGRLMFFTTADGTATPVERLRINHTGDILNISSGSFGYGTGSGGSVTQATSKSTGVTLNKTNGRIITSNATLGAGAQVIFTVTNSTVAATDTVIIHRASGGTANAYTVWVDAVAAGSFNVALKNSGSASNLSEAVTLNFSTIAAVTA